MFSKIQTSNNCGKGLMTLRNIRYLKACGKKKMTSILNSKSCDLKHGSTLSNHYEVILSVKSLVILKDQVQNLVHKKFIKEIYFHRLFDGIFKVIIVESYMVSQPTGISSKEM